jgi:transposase-like protein
MAVILAAEQTYRKAAETLQLLGIQISHETIHQDVQVA